VAALNADAGGLLLADPRDSRLALPGAVGYDEGALSRLRNESRDADLPAAMALRTGESVWLETREERDRLFPELAGLEPTMEALCAVPLAVGDRRLGAMRFSFRRPRLFDADEQRFVMALADQAAQALDRAQLQHDRIDVSQRLQRSLLPPDLPVIPGVELAAVYHPFGDGVDVGGDFYDAWHLGDDQWAIAIGDASGTGPEAAALTALVRHSLRALSLSERRPEEVLRQLNTLLTTARRDGERFCTAVFGVVTVGAGVQIDLAGGGHPGPMLRRPDGVLETVQLTGALLGVLDDVSIDRTHLTLDTGSVLVLYTDGIIESRSLDGVFFDESGVEAVLAEPLGTALSVAETLERAVLAHCGGTAQDDMAIMALRSG
jgi:serine phosphatase RsbU (regulator of sigma subunit)